MAPLRITYSTNQIGFSSIRESLEKEIFNLFKEIEFFPTPNESLMRRVHFVFADNTFKISKKNEHIIFIFVKHYQYSPQLREIFDMGFDDVIFQEEINRKGMERILFSNIKKLYDLKRIQEAYDFLMESTKLIHFYSKAYRATRTKVQFEPSQERSFEVNFLKILLYLKTIFSQSFDNNKTLIHVENSRTPIKENSYFPEIMVNLSLFEIISFTIREIQRPSLIKMKALKKSNDLCCISMTFFFQKLNSSKPPRDQIDTFLKHFNYLEINILEASDVLFMFDINFPLKHPT